jgi:hypothetical protein
MPRTRIVFCVLILSVAGLGQAAPAAPAGGCGDQSKVPADKRVTNTPKWTTASEVDNFGYEVFRGEKEAGPFVKLTKEPILGAGTTDETHNYKFADTTIDPCKDYWYYVESITTSGTREKFTPVFKAPAKRHAGETAKPADKPTAAKAPADKR